MPVNPLSQPQGVGMRLREDVRSVVCVDCRKVVLAHDAAVLDENAKVHKWVCCDCADKRAYMPGSGPAIFLGLS